MEEVKERKAVAGSEEHGRKIPLDGSKELCELNADQAIAIA